MPSLGGWRKTTMPTQWTTIRYCYWRKRFRITWLGRFIINGKTALRLDAEYCLFIVGCTNETDLIRKIRCLSAEWFPVYEWLTNSSAIGWFYENSVYAQIFIPTRQIFELSPQRMFQLPCDHLLGKYQTKPRTQFNLLVDTRFFVEVGIYILWLLCMLFYIIT